MILTFAVKENQFLEQPLYLESVEFNSASHNSFHIGKHLECQINIVFCIACNCLPHCFLCIFLIQHGPDICFRFLSAFLVL